VCPKAVQVHTLNSSDHATKSMNNAATINKTKLNPSLSLLIRYVDSVAQLRTYSRLLG